MDFMLVESLDDLIDVAVVNGERWDGWVAFGDLHAVNDSS